MNLNSSDKLLYAAMSRNIELIALVNLVELQVLLESSIKQGFLTFVDVNYKQRSFFYTIIRLKIRYCTIPSL